MQNRSVKKVQTVSLRGVVNVGCSLLRLVLADGMLCGGSVTCRRGASSGRQVTRPPQATSRTFQDGGDDCHAQDLWDEGTRRAPLRAMPSGMVPDGAVNNEAGEDDCLAQDLLDEGARRAPLQNMPSGRVPGGAVNSAAGSDSHLERC
jgi:hypothetical protein